VFEASRHPLHTASGQNLLAHELTHVVQQEAGSGHAAVRVDVEEDGPAEREAERAERALASGGSTGELRAPARPASPALQRKVPPEHVSCRRSGVPEFDVTGDEAV